MIASVRGMVAAVGPDYVIIETSGIGFRIFVPLSTLEHIQAGEESLLHTYLHVREDALLLYGFLTPIEKEVFQKLLSVNGVGPKIALNILSVLSIEQINEGIKTQNFTFFSAVPGIGPKTAQRIVLELAGKLPEDGGGKKEVRMGGRSSTDEAIEALVALGYTLQVASQVTAKVQKENPADSTVDLVKKALKELVKR